MNLPKLLILTDWYLPAYKAGGPIKSISNFASQFQNKFDIKIFTSNTDKSKVKESIDVIANRWVMIGSYAVFYASTRQYIANLILQVKKNKPDVVYFNSIFSFRYSVMPLLFFRIGILPKTRLIVAPRGMLQTGALALKSNKKRGFIKIANSIKLYKNVHFHATDEVEKNDIIRQLKIDAQWISVVSNIPSNSEPFKLNVKSRNQLNLVFLARISEKKNLALVLKALKVLPAKVQVHFDIFGPKEDAYFDSLQTEILTLPSNVSCTYKGELTFNQVNETLVNYHAYILPTQGENFGHSIYEALINGLPVIISDQTPWRNLREQKVGFDIPLAKPEDFAAAISLFAKMDESEWQEWSTNARNYALDFYASQDFEKGYTKLVVPDKKIGIVGPFPITRFKGGIYRIVQHIKDNAQQFEERGLSLHFINTCQTPRSSESMGKWNLQNILNGIKTRKVLFEEISKNDLAVLHFFTSIDAAFLKDLWLVRATKKKLNIRVLLHFQFTDLKEIFPSNNFLKQLTIKWLKKYVDDIIVLSEVTKNSLTQLGCNQQITVVPNFHLGGTILHKTTKSEVLSLLFLASIDGRKGFAECLQIIQKLRELGVPFKLTVGGEFMSVAYKKKIMAYVAEHNLSGYIDWKGYVDGAEKEAVFAASDVLILPTKAEGIPLALLEAMYHGLAVVTTNIDGLREIFSNVNYPLFEPNDMERMAKQVVNYAANKEELEKHREICISLAQNYSFERFAEKIMEVYN